MQIVGCGLAGLIAGNLFPKAELFEASPRSSVQHRAVLRFRSANVGDALGIEFKKVRVHKGIWFNGAFRAPTIRLANLYSKKVIGRLADRSIWNLEAVDRYIAPEDLIEQLADRVAHRTHWDTAFDFDYHRLGSLVAAGKAEPIISTVPMSVHEAAKSMRFVFAPIEVHRWRIPNASVHQTIYFPSPDTRLYRASITGSLLIAEYVATESAGAGALMRPFKAFGIDPDAAEPIDESQQRFGKIAPIDETWRKRFVFDLTSRYHIFSLGRFATWRNILLDDVLEDINVIRKLLNASAYDRSKIAF